MNIMIDACPESVEISGHLFYINTDFISCYKIATLIEKEIDHDNIIKMFKLFYQNYQDIPEDFTEHGLYMIQFITGATKKPKKTDMTEKTEAQERVFSFDQDATYIYSAFRQVYQINLIDNSLNWWQFKALFDGLPSNTKLSQVINIRSMDIPTGKGSEGQRTKILELKELYALQEQDNIKRKQAAMAFESLRPR